MLNHFFNFRHSLIAKLIVAVGLTLFLAIAIWAFFNIRYQKDRMIESVVASTDQLGSTIRLGAHYAMMLNSRDDINQIIQNIARQENIITIRIYNKAGQIKFSNRSEEVDRVTNIKAEACYICHRTDPPLSELNLEARRRIVQTSGGARMLGVISPIYNEPGCSTDACHVHPGDKKILGALDVVVSLAATDQEIMRRQKAVIALALVVFLLASTAIFILVVTFIKTPIRRLINGTRRIARGDYSSAVDIPRDDEMGQLAAAINRMGEKIGEKQSELNKERDRYEELFELVPCILTIQDRDFRILDFNREFADRFDPKPGDYCYQAYKGRSEKCEVCPVEKTFADGRSHYSEETGFNKDGTRTHWIVKTSPVKNEKGDIVAAMEMSLDITHRRQLEEELEKSEKKYHAIFNSIPNPVFVLDVETLTVLDCNDSVRMVYGLEPGDVLGRSFLDLFVEEERQHYADKLKTSEVINQVKQVDRSGRPLFVNIRVSPSEYAGQKVLLVTTSDVTKRLEAEMQLIQASKMATLGEMATGVAHELNQPLSVIKTASSFFMKKVRKKERIADEVLLTLAEEVDSHVDRATRIINHMRQFGRKSDLSLEPVQVNEVAERAFEIFSQQLKLREIEVVWDLDPGLPTIQAEPARLEQVFINLLINARDAIEARWGTQKKIGKCEKRITLRTRFDAGRVVAELADTGSGVPEIISGKIFDPFFTTKKVGEGTGLGLSISYGIVQDFGGTIQAVPAPGGGACFVIAFPCQDGKR